MVYKITFEVKTPIITDTPIHLDGLLSAVHPAMHGTEIITRNSTIAQMKDAPLPIDSAKIGNVWVWCCTAANYSDDAVPYQDHITKRKVACDYFYIESRQTPRTGPGRDRCDTVYGVSCSTASFLASTKDRKEIERICRRVKNIGGLRKMGYGEVTRFEVEETLYSWRDCLEQEGIAVRNLPSEMLETPCNMRVPVKHPYWHPDHYIPGAFAGYDVKLKSEVWLNAY